MSTPDLNIQTHNVQKSQLPLLNSDNEYVVRYRIKTLDGATTTSWSPVYRAKKDSIESFFNPTTGTHRADVTAKSHGESFDVSWRIHNATTDLSEIPEQVDGLPLDAYVRWGGKITSVSNIGTIYTISVNYDHNFFIGQTITAEGTTEDQQQNYTVLEIVDTRSFTIQTLGLSTTYLQSDNRLWSKWEFVTTTSSNSFSLPIPLAHQAQIENGVRQERYAEFMVHLATFIKDRQEVTAETLVFYSDSVDTRATYDAGSIV